VIQLAYINNANSPGGALGYESANPYGKAIGVFNLFVEVLTTAAQIWRLWTIWSTTRYTLAVIILPVLLLLSYIALDIPANLAVASLPLSQLGHSANALTISAYTVLAALTVIVSGLVVARILYVQRHRVKSMENRMPPVLNSALLQRLSNPSLYRLHGPLLPQLQLASTAPVTSCS